jgi:hypothetical protein
VQEYRLCSGVKYKQFAIKALANINFNNVCALSQTSFESNPSVAGDITGRSAAMSSNQRHFHKFVSSFGF